MNTAIRNDTPEEVMAARAEGDPTKARWSPLESMLALLIDEVRINTWAYVQSNSKSSVPRPDPIRRPGVTVRRRKTLNLADAQKLDPRLAGLGEAEAQAMLDRITGRG